MTTVGPPPGTTDEAPDPAPSKPMVAPRFYRLRKPPRRLLAVTLWTLWMIAGAAVALGAAVVLYVDDSISAARPVNDPAFRAAVAATDPALPDEPVNILLMGSDKRPTEGDRGRSDSLILVKMDPDRDFISMLSFPRDLRVEIPGVGVDKINAAYFYGEKTSIETVKKLTGEPVHHFVNIDFQGFVRLVNAVGGVYLDVDRKYFNDNTQSGEKYDMLDIDPGYQKLNGDDALDFARYRHTDSDFARIVRQQMFLSELKRQTKRIENLINLPAFGRIFRQNIQMSIDRDELVKILQLALTVDKARIARTRVQGGTTLRDGISFVEASPGAVAEAVEAWKNPDFVEAAPAKKITPGTVRVQVLNGNGQVLSAESGTALLAKKGFKATSGGNAASFDHATTEVLYSEGKRDEGRAVQRLFGPGTVLSQMKRANRRVDVQVIMGTDFTGQLYVPPPPTPVKAETVWTDSLVPLLRRAQGSIKNQVKMVAPLRVPPGSELRRVRLYRVNTQSKGGPWAIKLVFRIPPAGGLPGYWSFSMTQWDENIPIMEGETGILKHGGRQYRTFYDGRALMRVGWKQNGMTYWVSNTLDNRLNSETMNAIARSAQPVATAKLPKGQTSTAIPIETDASTP